MGLDEEQTFETSPREREFFTDNEIKKKKYVARSIAFESSLNASSISEETAKGKAIKGAILTGEEKRQRQRLRIR